MRSVAAPIDHQKTLALSRGLVRPDFATLVGGLLALVAFALFATPTVDPDYGWHVANGRHLLDGVLFAGRDVYSWTAPGATWVAHEWASEGVMAALNDSIGGTANAILATVIASAGVALTYARVRAREVSTVAAAATTGLVLLAIIPVASVRPFVVELLGLPLVLALLDAFRERVLGTRATALSVVAVMVVWANAHGSFPVGPGVLAIGAVGMAIERDPRALRLAAITALGVAATLINPFGTSLLGYVGQALVGTRLGLITEWAPPDLAEAMWIPFAIELALAALAVAAGLTLLARRRATDPRPQLPLGMRVDDILIAGATAVVALRAGYHVGLFAIGAAPLVAGLLNAIVGGGATRRRTAPARPALNLAILGFAAVLACAAVFVKAGPAANASAMAADYPTAALPVLDRLACAEGGSLHLLNEYGWGGYLEMERPNIKVFIDGRSEVYGDALIARFAGILALEPGWSTELDRLGVNTALVSSTGAVAKAIEGRGWSTVYRDQLATLLVRPAPPAGPFDDGTRCANQ